MALNNEQWGNKHVSCPLLHCSSLIAAFLFALLTTDH
jgi:hypothetical protein